MDARGVKREWYWILPSESREKSRQKLKSPCAGAPQHMYSRPSLPQKRSRSPPKPDLHCLVAFRATRTAESPHYYSTGAHRIPNHRPWPRENEQNLVCEPMAVRSQSSSGNCFDTPSSHFRTVTRPARCVARLTREIKLLFSFSSPLRFGWLRRAGMSHSLGSLRRTVTLSIRLVPWRSERLPWCHAGPAIVVFSAIGHPYH